LAEPERVSPAQEGQELSVLVDAPQKTLVTVRILDAGGKELRALYTGFVEAGHWNFKWDGLLENGQPAGAGEYRIDVQTGAAHQTKDIRLKIQPVSP
jgi:flagellar hook assembly protein FlgD